MSDLILSASGITAYLSCPRRWYMIHVLRARRLTQNLSAAIGVATHAGVESLNRGKTLLEATAALTASWVEEVASVPTADLAVDPDGLQDAATMLRVYDDKVYPTYKPTLVEHEFTASVYGVLLTGTIDGADEATDAVHDTKTTSGKTINGRKPNFSPDGYRLQLSIYGAGYKSITGRWPKSYELDVLTRRGTYRHYDLTPDFGEMRDAIEITAAGIARGDFRPSGAAAGRCKFCPVRFICEYSTERVA
jgi:hypothetical protein